jgi:hypothetical protein
MGLSVPLWGSTHHKVHANYRLVEKTLWHSLQCQAIRHICSMQHVWWEGSGSILCKAARAPITINPLPTKQKAPKRHIENSCILVYTRSAHFYAETCYYMQNTPA